MKIKTTSTGRLFLLNGVLALIASIPAAPADPGPAPEGTITVANERQVRWIYQRIGVTKSVAVSGTCTAPAGTSVEARIVDETTGIAIGGWAVVGTVQADSSYAGTFVVPQGKWYRRQVRIANSATAIATETNSFGVGIGIAELGQSNMANFKSSGGWKYPLGDPNAYEYSTSGVLRRVGNVSAKNASGVDKFVPNTLFGGTGGYQNTSGGDASLLGTNADGYVYVANLVAETTGLPVFVINLAVGGTSIETYWKTGQTGWTNFATALTSIGKDCEIALWMQGENNAAAMPGATYQGHLTDLQNQFYTLTGRDASNFKFGVISLGPTSTGAGGYAGTDPQSFGRMRVAQRDWAVNTPGAFYVTGAHDMDLTAAGDTIHITGEGFSALGRRYAKSVNAALGFGTTSAGPKMVSAARSGAIVTVTIAHTGGTALQDGAGGTGTALKGFEFKDGAGAIVAITGTQITSPTTVQLTLASAPSGACALSYAMYNSPYTTDPNDVKSGFLPASVLRDNAKYYDAIKATTDNPLGSPMQPCAPIAVT